MKNQQEGSSSKDLSYVKAIRTVKAIETYIQAVSVDLDQIKEVVKTCLETLKGSPENEENKTLLQALRNFGEMAFCKDRFEGLRLFAQCLTVEGLLFQQEKQPEKSTQCYFDAYAHLCLRAKLNPKLNNLEDERIEFAKLLAKEGLFSKFTLERLPSRIAELESRYSNQSASSSTSSGSKKRKAPENP